MWYCYNYGNCKNTWNTIKKSCKVTVVSDVSISVIDHTSNYFFNHMPNIVRHSLTENTSNINMRYEEYGCVRDHSETGPWTLVNQRDATVEFKFSAIVSLKSFIAKIDYSEINEATAVIDVSNCGNGVELKDTYGAYEHPCNYNGIQSLYIRCKNTTGNNTHGLSITIPLNTISFKFNNDTIKKFDAKTFKDEAYAYTKGDTKKTDKTYGTELPLNY